MSELEQIATASSSESKISSTLRGRGHPELGRDAAGRRLVRVVDRPDRRAGHLVGDQLGVHPADSPDADDPDLQRCDGGGHDHFASPGGGGGWAGMSIIGGGWAGMSISGGGWAGMSISGTTGSQPPLSFERSSAACTDAHASACSKLGSNGRSSATAVQNS